MSETRGAGIPLKRVQPIHRGTHDVTKAYETLDIVVNASNTAAYMAVQDVPVGTALTDTGYWGAIVNVSGVVDNVNSAVNANKEELQNNIDANKKETDEAISQLSEEIGEFSDGMATVVDTVDVDVKQELDIKTDGYYQTNGTFSPTTDRQYAIVENVDLSAVYKLTTDTQSALIAGAIYRNADGAVIGYELLGTGSLIKYTKQILNVPEECASMIVQCTNLSPLKLYVADSVFRPKSIMYTVDTTVHVGEDIAARSDTTTTLSGFTGDIASGFTHPTGNANSGIVQIYNGTFATGVYIVEFDVDYTGGEFVKCGFENDYKNLAYNGGSHITMPVTNSDGTKYFIIENITDVAYTITNLHIRKVDDDGADSITISRRCVTTPADTVNLGFWNVILGYNSLDESAGSTRTIAIGNNALGKLQCGHRNIGIGTFAMSQMTGGEGNISIGADSMLEVKESSHNVAIGREACYGGKNLADNVAVGHSALFGGANSEAYYNVAVGANAGHKCTSHRNTMIGYQAGYNITSQYGNTMIGFNTLGAASGYDNTCIGKQADFANGIHNATAIGANAKCTKSNQMVLGDANVYEFVLGNKKIKFDDDGTVTWEAVQ